MSATDYHVGVATDPHVGADERRFTTVDPEPELPAPGSGTSPASVDGRGCGSRSRLWRPASALQPELAPVARAEARGVDVEGGWVNGTGTAPSWGVEIYEAQRSSPHGDADLGES